MIKKYERLTSDDNESSIVDKQLVTRGKSSHATTAARTLVGYTRQLRLQRRMRDEGSAAMFILSGESRMS